MNLSAFKEVKTDENAIFSDNNNNTLFFIVFIDKKPITNEIFL